MIFTKKIVVEGSQIYAMTQGDVIIMKVKGSEEFRFKVPDNWKGDIGMTISGQLEEINPE